MSKRRDNDTGVLPGLENMVPQQGRPGELDLSDARRYTGEVLYRDHPDVFKAVAAALFIDGLSQRMVAARYRVSVNTVRAIRDMALDCAATDAGRAAFFIKQKADQLRGIVRTRALEVILDRLSNPQEVEKIDVDTLLKLANLEQEHPEKTDNQKSALGDVIDVDEFDSVLNGLDAGKKSAPEDVPGLGAADGESDDVEEGVADVEKGCSTGNNSVQQSNENQYLQGENTTLCNSSCKTDSLPAANDGSGSDGSRADTPAATALEGPPMWAGGRPGACAPGGVN